MTSLTKTFTSREEYDAFLYGKSPFKKKTKSTKPSECPWFLDGPMKGKKLAMQAPGHDLIQFPVAYQNNWWQTDAIVPTTSEFQTHTYKKLGVLQNGRPVYAYQGGRSC